MTASAKSIRTPEENMPQIIDVGARILAATSAKEKGTYALYGVIERDNPNLMRLLEIYESDEAYRIHSTSEAFLFASKSNHLFKSIMLSEKF